MLLATQPQDVSSADPCSAAIPNNVGSFRKESDGDNFVEFYVFFFKILVTIYHLGPSGSLW